MQPCLWDPVLFRMGIALLKILCSSYNNATEPSVGVDCVDYVKEQVDGIHIASS
jgi:hypothetical protein